MAWAVSFANGGTPGLVMMVDRLCRQKVEIHTLQRRLEIEMKQYDISFLSNSQVELSSSSSAAHTRGWMGSPLAGFRLVTTCTGKATETKLYLLPLFTQEQLLLPLTTPHPVNLLAPKRMTCFPAIRCVSADVGVVSVPSFKVSKST